MARKMLVDAAHLEELRVVVCDNGKIEEFDYQNTEKKSTKGNIYLAKVTRVEPSLQAAFVDYGAQRHGFLPFSEIHPVYYQIPVSDRDKLLEEMSRAHKSKNEPEHKLRNPKGDEDEEDVIDHDEDGESDYDIKERPQFYRRYRIQEVIKKDQVILVQIEKEERSTKGASLTTYLSLAGRYCVLMPNATKGGGVSRKINDDQDRARLKKIASEMTNDLEGQGAVIIRTAGSYKTKTEIRRDFQYLQRLWNNIRDHTVKSNAPAFIHEEGDVIKKAIRDLYDSEIEEVLVEGERAFEDAKNFMKLILPRHLNKVKLYQDKLPLFSRYNVEEQIGELYSHQVRLRSGGYLVINHTEALVAIDVNSGRSTGERNVENTAVRTNIEAAQEIAKQLHLRDLSGLIVVDFIDMEEMHNRKTVERELKHALLKDKAKVQTGRISSFGLLEMSRQRLNQSLLEANTETCDYCNGRGRIRHMASTAIVVLRAIEREVASSISGEIHVSASSQLILHILNHKREQINTLEKKFDGKIILYIDETAGGDGFFIEKKHVQPRKIEEKAPSGIDQAVYQEQEELEIKDDEPQLGPINKRKNFKKPLRNKPVHSKPQQGRPSNQGQSSHQGQEQQAGHQPSSGRKIKHSRRDGHHRHWDRDAFGELEVPNAQAHHEAAESFYQHELQLEGKIDDRRRNNHDRHKKNGGRNFRGRHNASPQTSEQVNFNREQKKQSDFAYQAKPSEENEEFNPKVMAERRKQNQSLLKEIWKKIVD